MNKRLLAFAPVALAAGVMLLTACGQTDQAAQVGKKSSSSDSVDVKTDGFAKKVTGDDLQPVECGPVEVHTVTHMLVADPTSGGIVGCTEAFNVVDEYLNALPGEPGDPFSTITLPSGWTCSKDDGEFAAIDCKKGEGDFEFAFHTEKPADEGDAQPVECGPVEVHTVTHTLVADATSAGVVGCTEAFNVVDEYLNALPGEPGDPFSTITLPSGWTCSKDDGEFAAIDCKNDDGFALHTEKPADEGDGQPVECGPVELHNVAYTLFADPTPAGTVGCTEAFNVVDEYFNALPGEPGDPSSTITLPSGWTCMKDDGEFEAIYCDTDAGLALHTEPAK
jgi:hypothetical protein